MKIDKGLELNYWNLSYRRKFIRTFWVIPIVIVATLLVWFIFQSFELTLTCFAVLAIVWIVQATYTYKKWKNGSDKDTKYSRNK